LQFNGGVVGFTMLRLRKPLPTRRVSLGMDHHHDQSSRIDLHVDQSINFANVADAALAVCLARL
jgi:hypothetical protein